MAWLGLGVRTSVYESPHKCKAACAAVQLGLALLTCMLCCYHDDARRARPTPYRCYGNAHSFFGLCLRARCISQLVMAGGWWEWVWVSALVPIKPEAPRLQEKITQISGCPPLQRFGNICSYRHVLMAALPLCWGPNTDLKLHKPWKNSYECGGWARPAEWLGTFSNTFLEDVIPECALLVHEKRLQSTTRMPLLEKVQLSLTFSATSHGLVAGNTVS